MPDGTGTVITGLGAVCAIALDVASLGPALCGGRSAMRTSAGATLDDFDFHQALAAKPDVAAGLRRRAARVAGRAPPPIQVAAIAALEAWTSAGLHSHPLPPEAVALVVAGHNLTGRQIGGAAETLRANPAYVSPRLALQMLDTDHVGALSEILTVAGEGFTIGGASASGNLGIIAGSRLIECGAVDACVVIGALQQLSAVERQALVNLGALAADGTTPFDVSAAGFVPGEGCACLVLESAAGASRRGAEVRAALAGYAQKLDGNRLTDPASEGEVAVMRAALQRAAVAPEDVQYVNAHGSGTPLGDATEAGALIEVFGTGPARPWVNSTKGLVGHCLSAAGVLEAVATVVQHEGGFVHPNVGLREAVDPGLRLVGRRAEPVRIRHALSNSFGFGGFNSAVVVSAP